MLPLIRELPRTQTTGRWLACLMLLMSFQGVEAKRLRAQETNWEKLDLSLSTLEKWGTRQYTVFSREPGQSQAKKMGTLTLTTQVKTTVVLLKDRFQLNMGGEPVELDLIHECTRNNFLAPRRIKSEGKGSDEVQNFSVTVANGKAQITTPAGQQTSMDLPAGTISMAAMMRLVTLVPRTPGRAFNYEHCLESEELNLKPKFQLTVLPVEMITVGEQRLKCSKFKLTGNGIHPQYFWVSDDNLLQRVLIDNMTTFELDR